MAAKRLSLVLNHVLQSKPGLTHHPSIQLCTQFQEQATQIPSIHADPRVALYDDKVKIKLKNFPSNQKVTLHGQFIQKKKEEVIFASCGHYVTDDTGSLSVCEQHSTGGTYTGVEPMGIVWSLQPAPGQPEHTRMAINFTDKPTLINLHTYLGHLGLEDIYQSSTSCQDSVAQLQLERWFRFPDITRIEVDAGNIRGALFLPPGEGPFQGVIDMFGSAGGLIEYRSALLASRGFATLSLAYFRYKDLVKNLENVSFDYFEEAAQWLSTHPKVFPHGIGVVAVSKGVDFAYLMSAYFPQVKSVVAINGYPYLTFCDLKYKGKTFMKGSKFDSSSMEFSEEGVIVGNSTKYEDNMIPAWQGEAKHLLLVSEDDFQADPSVHQMLLDACPQEKRSNFQIVRFPGAGHLLEPPYTALCRTTVNPTFDILFLFGGRRKEHAHAQEKSWQLLLNHLRENIPTTK